MAWWHICLFYGCYRLASLLLLSLSGQAIARQYAYPGAYPYAVPQHAYNPYAGAPYPYPAAGNARNPYAGAPQPYYPANRYPVQPLRPGGYHQPVISTGKATCRARRKHQRKGKRNKLCRQHKAETAPR